MIGLVVVIPSAGAWADACSAPLNVIACENAQPGTPESVWDINGAGDDEIQGFATDMSVNAGQTIDFKVSTAASSYTIDIYRLGWYGGNGARKITSVNPSAPLPQNQPACVSDTTTGIYDCGTWGVSASWAVPSSAVSGVYFALLTAPNPAGGHWASQIPFVVRDDASHSAMVFKTSDATWEAYNLYGGLDFYPGVGGRAYKLSYNRPYSTRQSNGGRDFLFSNEYPMIRFLERNGYDVSYITDVDADRAGPLIANHKAFISVGHDEYWSGAERAAVVNARDTAGTSLAFFSGNEVYWKTRWEGSVDGNNTGHRTLVCYKETWANAKSDPSPLWTGTFRDPRFSPPSDGGNPENALTGTVFQANSDDLTMQVPAAQGLYRFWRNTDIATQAPGGTASLAPHTVGYESDEDVDNGFRPASLIDLSTTVGSTPQYLTDFGNVTVPGTTTHHLTLYKVASGALVFGAGTVQWAWGLDDSHDSQFSPIAPPDSRMQQATINLFADMGLQPTTLMPGMILASASTDTTAPTADITSPGVGASAVNGSQVTVTGTAADVGGVVAGVEVSTDGGGTWHPASGTTNWSYSYYATGDGQSVISARAIDDTVNVGTPATRSLTLTGPTTLFGGRTPVTAAASDSSAVEVGVKVVPQTDGYISGVRFYKGTGNTGTHVGSLWSASGTRLASGVFSGESASGWQTMTFSQPVAVVTGTTYVASYTAPSGHYAADSSFFYRPFLAAPLTAPANFASGGNGVYGTSGHFPTQSYQAANYYVDVLFTSTATTPPSVVGVTPVPNAQYQSVSTHPTATFNKPVDAGSVSFTLKDPSNATVAGSTSYDSTSKTATFTPSAALVAGQTFTASVSATDTNGNTMSGPQTWTFQTDPGNTTVNTLFAANATPGNPAVNDPRATSVGVKFTPSSDGTVIGVRFYKGPGNGGTHTGSLWTSTGSLLATATFSSETGTGWQTVYFNTPVAVAGGTTYVASYFAPLGDYAGNAGFFNSTYTNGPLSAPSGSNGIYRYDVDGFPTSSFSNSNYWVDPLFVAAPPAQQPNLPQGSVTIFPTSSTPANPNWNDHAAVDVGVTFTSDVAGTVKGVRFYKGNQNTGTHTGSLWTSSGTLLATGTFVGETASGWQTMLFTTPVSIAAGTTYLVSYHTTVGCYSVNVNAFQSAGVNNPPLHVSTGGSRYRYGSGGFPNSTSNHNFWVDVVFSPGG
jgi:hypothetical protein